jgi:uncharacterized repeat protein (TIGR03847 family)
MSPAPRSVDWKRPDHFTAGAVGRPGERTFSLQAREAGSVLTLKAEKEQVAALAEYLAKLLDKRPAGALAGITVGDLALLEPLEEAWTVGSIGVGQEPVDERIVLVIEEREEQEEDQPSAAAAAETASARLAVTPSQARAFVERTRELVQAGRKACPVCGRPINLAGHVCPRSNGRTHD